ncbi:MAG TPA: GNAT family N-acyltransferase [Stellaceae bacterium]|nr:GNAT family N-acyltransferase [Stellaceae bacterium]
MRLAEDAAEIDAAQALRYRVFYEEMGATPSAEMAKRRRDFDHFDGVCDHLLVLDHSEGSTEVVGTYRFIRRSVAARSGGFYSAAEYDLGPITDHPGEILELGRSCTAASARLGPAAKLMWRGIAAYVFHHRIEVMFGCASLHGTDPDALALPLAYLHHFHRAPPALRMRALDDRYVEMNRMAKEAIDATRAQAVLPPLIKGYLRLGGFVGDGAVIDRPFNTTDVSIVVKTDLVAGKYYRHYERRAREDAAAG